MEGCISLLELAIVCLIISVTQVNYNCCINSPNFWNEGRHFPLQEYRKPMSNHLARLHYEDGFHGQVAKQRNGVNVSAVRSGSRKRKLIPAADFLAGSLDQNLQLRAGSGHELGPRSTSSVRSR